MKTYHYPSLINLSNSILKHFNAETFHETIPEIDEALKGYKKVVAVLFDGMGRNIVRKHLKENSFIRTHHVTTINSTFPPTTSAATISFLTGKYPIETGWLGWNMYFKDVDRNIILFRGVDYNTGENLNIHVEQKYFPVKRIFELIEEGNNNAKAFCVQRYPIQPDGVKKLIFEGVPRLNKVLKENEECFIYFYWDSPDYEMHTYGIDHPKVRHQVHKAEKFLKKLAKSNPDTKFILLADHGHINVKFFDISKQEDIYSLIDKPLSLEKRTTSFFIKKGKEAEFAELFKKYYGNYFELLTKKEAFEQEIFGKGKPAPGVEDCLGDYIAVATKEYGLYVSNELSHNDNFKGHHAGGTEEERLIDISVF